MSTSSDSIRVVGEKDLLELARIPRGTWSAWARKGHFEDSASGLYGESEVISAAVFNLLADALLPRNAAIAWKDCGQAVVHACLQLPLDSEECLVLVVDSHLLDGAVATKPEELFEIVNGHVTSPRGWITFPIAALAREARRGFWKRARPASDLVRDKRRKVAQNNPGKAI